MASPEISIVIPAFNAETTISRALDSILAQSFTDYEVIVVNDCSTDLTQSVTERYGSKVVVINLDYNQGVGPARNRGIEHASGRYIAFLDADDFWAPRKLEKQLAFMKRYDFKASCCSVNYLRCQDSRLDVVFQKRPVSKINLSNYRCLFRENRICTSSVILEKKLLEKNLFRDVRNRQDLILWIELIRQGTEFGGLDEALVSYDLSVDGISRDKLKMLLANYKAFRFLLGSRIAASYYTILSAVNNIFLRTIRRTKA